MAWLKGQEVNGLVEIAKNVIFKGTVVQKTPFAYSYYNDFFTYNASEWTVTEIGASGTEALTDGAGGQLLITTDALDNDGVQMQLANESFLPASGKDMWFESRMQLVTAAKHVQSDFLIGLADLDTTILDAPSDGIYFTKADGSAAVSAVTNVGSAATSTASVLTFAPATWYRFGFYVRGSSTVYFYVDGVLVATHTAGITATELTPTFAVLNGENGAVEWKIDYFNVAQIR